MNPRDIAIETIFPLRYPGNYRKRIDRIDRLASEIGAEVAYGMNTTSCGVTLNGLYYESDGLRQTEMLLRTLKKQESKQDG